MVTPLFGLQPYFNGLDPRLRFSIREPGIRKLRNFGFGFLSTGLAESLCCCLKL